MAGLSPSVNGPGIHNIRTKMQREKPNDAKR